MYLRNVMEEKVYSFVGGIEESEDDDSVGGDGGAEDSSKRRRKGIYGMKVTKQRMPPSLYYDINGPISQAYISIYDIVYNDVVSGCPADRVKSIIVCSVVRLVTTCGSALNGELTDLGVLLGAPIQLPRQDVLDRAEDFTNEDREVS